MITPIGTPAVTGYAARTSVEESKPGTPEKGRLLAVFVYLEASAKVISVSPAPIESAQGAISTSFRLACFLVEDDGTSSKVKVTWEGSESKGDVLGISAWEGVDLTHPFDVQGAITRVTTQEFTVPSIKTVTAGAMDIIFEANSTGWNLSSVPGGWTRDISGSPLTLYHAREAAGETGTQALKLEGTAANIGYFRFALRPASGGKVELALGPAAGAAATALALNAPTRLPLGPAAGAAATALTLTVPSPAVLPLGPAAGAASTSLALRAPARLPLGPAAGAAATSLVLTAPTKTPPRVAVTREYPPDQLAWRVKPPKGRPSRWAADEPLAEKAITGIQLNDVMSGGIGGDDRGGGVLARNPRESWPDLAPFSECSVYGPGVEEVASYRLADEPDADGDHAALNPVAKGHKDLLDDDQAVLGPGFINSDLSAWTGPSVARRAALAAVNWPAQDPSLNWGPSGPALRLEVQNGWTTTLPICEAWFDAGSGLRIAAVYGDWANGWSDLNFELYIRFADTDTGDNEGSGEAYAAVTGHISQAPAIPRRYIRIPWNYNTAPAGYEGGAFGVDLQNMKVVADHGLPLRGAWPNVGFTVSQMLGYAVPLHTDLKAEPEDLEDSGYIVQHAWYPGPGPISAVVTDLMKYEQLDAFVFGEKRFQLRFPGTYGRKWKAYAGPSRLTPHNLDTSRLWRTIVVAAQDVNGQTITVGPPGSGATVEDPGLEITDPDHPAVQADVPRRDLLTLSNIATPARMIETGERFLAEANLLNRAASATLSSYVQDDKGIFRPVSQVRAGDLIRFPDAGDDTSYRKIVTRAYDHDSRTTGLELDAPVEGLEVMLARMQADLTALQLS